MTKIKNLTNVVVGIVVETLFASGLLVWAFAVCLLLFLIYR